MNIYPAIDLYQGNCVRLYQGDFEQATNYYDDPVQHAKNLSAQGADWLHIVDLDGAKDPQCQQLDLILKIAKETDLNIQIGGGIRSKQHIDRYLRHGIARVIIGSQAVRHPDMVKDWFGIFGGDKIVLAVDIDVQGPSLTDMKVAISAWQQRTAVSLDELIAAYVDVGLRHILCTDIARDGALTGPNVDLYQSILQRYPNLLVQASGGCAQLSDLPMLRGTGVSAVVIGRALYEGLFTLEEALSC